MIPQETKEEVSDSLSDLESLFRDTSTQETLSYGELTELTMETGLEENTPQESHLLQEESTENLCEYLLNSQLLGDISLEYDANGK